MSLRNAHRLPKLPDGELERGGEEEGAFIPYFPFLAWFLSSSIEL